MSENNSVYFYTPKTNWIHQTKRQSAEQFTHTNVNHDPSLKVSVKPFQRLVGFGAKPHKKLKEKK